MACLRVPAASASAAAKKAAPTKTSKAAAVPVYEDDGNVEGLVKEARRIRGRPKKTSYEAAEIVMAGALAADDAESAGKPAEHGKATANKTAEGDGVPAGSTDELGRTSSAPASGRMTDELQKSDASLPVQRQRKGRMARKPVQSEAQSAVLDGLKKRMEAKARGEPTLSTKPAAPTLINKAPTLSNSAPSSDTASIKPKTARLSTNSRSGLERSEFSLSPSPPPAGKLKRTSLALSSLITKPQNTPAMETSLLALKNFKRRPRQPSMLQMVQQRTQQQQLREPQSVSKDPFAYEPEDIGGKDDEDEFAPEAEGTPMHAEKDKGRKSTSAKKTAAAKGKSPAENEAVSNPNKRKSASLGSSTLDALRAKKRSSLGLSTDEPGPKSKTRAVARSPSLLRQATPDAQITSEVQVIHSSAEPESSTPLTEPSSSDRRLALAEHDIIPSTEPHDGAVEHVPLNDIELDKPEQDIPNGTMAEPQSSSPPLVESERIPLSPMQPNIRRGRSTTEIEGKKKAKGLSTAALQALLPRRRQPLKPRHRKSEYDFDDDSDPDGQEEEVTLDASHLEQDEDELGGRLRHMQKTKTPVKSAGHAKGQKAVLARSKKQLKARPIRPPAAIHKSTTGARKSLPPPAKKVDKTYGRSNTASNKENEVDDADSDGDETALNDTTVPVSESRELEEARRKFAELDEWDMEFEDDDGGEEHRSSSQGWR